MLVKVRPKHGTTMHVHDRKKYYPGELKTVDDELGLELIRLKIALKIDEPEPKDKPKSVEEPTMFKRGPGRPRKAFH